MADIEELARKAIDCGLRIHRDLGPGFLESVYEAVMAASLARGGMQVERQKPIEIEYDGMNLGEGFQADLLVEGRLIIEKGDRPIGAGPCQAVAYLFEAHQAAPRAAHEFWRRDFSRRSQADRQQSRPLRAFAPLREPNGVRRRTARA